VFVFNNIIYAIAQILLTLLDIYFWVIIAATVISWVRPDPYNPIVRTLYALTEPVLYRVRKWLPFTLINGLDLSPVVVLIALQLIKNIVIRSLIQIADAI
jgi:YggT family protein